MQTEIITLRDEIKTYIRKEKFKSALKILNKLLQENPNDPSLYKEMSTCYRRLRRIDDATLSMKKSLELTLETSLDEIIPRIQKSINSNTSKVQSVYKCADEGGNNLGFIEHHNSFGDEYITKIVRSSQLNNELLFYLKLRKRFPNLETISPKVIHFIEKEDCEISFMTMEKLTGDIVHNEDHTTNILEIHKSISSIPYFKVKDFFPNAGDNEIILAGWPLPLTKIFSSLHQEAMNEKVFQWLYKELERAEYSDQLFDVVQRMEKIIIDQKMYEKLQPVLHYTLFHGDFHSANIMYDDKKNTYRIFDWAFCGIAVKGIDLVKYFRRKSFTFEEIERLYLSNQELNNNLVTIEKIFFIYMMVLSWIHFGKGRAYKKYDSCLLPAVEYMEKLTKELQ